MRTMDSWSYTNCGKFPSLSQFFIFQCFFFGVSHSGIVLGRSAGLNRVYSSISRGGGGGGLSSRLRVSERHRVHQFGEFHMEKNSLMERAASRAAQDIHVFLALFFRMGRPDRGLYRVVNPHERGADGLF